MKKIVTLILCVAMLCTMSISAFAAIDAIGGSEDGEVKATYQVSTGDEVYNVELSWGTMEFTYTVDRNWNTTTHTWDPAETGTWAPAAVGANVITITNHSSAAITASGTFASLDGFDVTGTVSAAVTLDAANGETVDTDTLTLTLDGSIAETVNTSTKVGTVTVTIGATA